jgi:hypothetical protein
LRGEVERLPVWNEFEMLGPEIVEIGAGLKGWEFGVRFKEGGYSAVLDGER